jgi:hypothetical protein
MGSRSSWPRTHFCKTEPEAYLHQLGVLGSETFAKNNETDFEDISIDKEAPLGRSLLRFPMSEDSH